MSAGKCEMYLVATNNRCNAPASFHVTSTIPAVKAEERKRDGDGEFCFAHAVQLAGYFNGNGQPEYEITPLAASLDSQESPK